jgi:hypothetical protein
MISESLKCMETTMNINFEGNLPDNAVVRILFF